MGATARLRTLTCALALCGCFRLGYAEPSSDPQPTAGNRGQDHDAGAPPVDCSAESVADADRDGVCDLDDLCDGDDTMDDDQDGVPDGCDLASCGNGQLDPGETCDPSSSNAACPGSCSAPIECQQSVRRGQPQACNVECVLSSITDAVDDDGCCPSGGEAASDTDCPATCGNQVLEPGEQCDGGSTCDSNCQWTLEGQCLQFEGTATTRCKECRCAQCTQEVITCFGPDSGFSEFCAPIVNCGDVARCFGDDCYCGQGPSCLVPRGACIDEIDASAAAADQDLDECMRSTSCAGYHANQLGACELDRCASECTE